MKNSEKLLDALGGIRDDLIPDADSKRLPAAFRNVLAAICGLCAAFAVIGVGMKIYGRVHSGLPADSGPDTTSVSTTVTGVTTTDLTDLPPQFQSVRELWENLPQAAWIPQKNGTAPLHLQMQAFAQPVSAADAGRLASPSALDAAQNAPAVLPVFQNLGCGADDPAKSPQALSEEQTKALLLRAAEMLELTPAEPAGIYFDEAHGLLTGYGYEMQSGGAVLSASRDGTVQLRLRQPLNGKSPETFVREQYGVLMNWSETAGVLRETGDTAVCCLYEQSHDPVSALLHENLCCIEAEIDRQTDTVTAVTFRNLLTAASYLGDYAVIPVQEALEQFLAFDLHDAGAQDVPPAADALPGGRVPENLVECTELLYRYDPHEPVIAPFYRIWVRTTGLTGDRGSAGESFTPFDVPAVREPADGTNGRTIWDGLDTASDAEKKTGTQKLVWDVGFIGTVQQKDDGMAVSHLMPSPAGRAEIDRDTLPVFRRGAVPNQMLSEEQMTALLTRTANALGLAPGTAEPNYKDNDNKILLSMEMRCFGAILTAEWNGTVRIRYTLAEPVPDDAQEQGTAVSDAAFIRYVTEKYRPLLQWEKTESYVRRDYSEIGGTEQKSYCIYEASDDPVQALLNDCLCRMEVTRDGAKGIGTVTFRNHLTNAEYIGEYERISEAEAREKLLSSDIRRLVPSLPADSPILDGNISGAELIYPVSSALYLPCYRFWVQLPSAEHSGFTEWKAIDIPAVRAELTVTPAHHGN